MFRPFPVKKEPSTPQPTIAQPRVPPPNVAVAVAAVEPAGETRKSARKVIPKKILDPSAEPSTSRTPFKTPKGTPKNTPSSKKTPIRTPIRKPPGTPKTAKKENKEGRGEQKKVIVKRETTDQEDGVAWDAHGLTYTVPERDADHTDSCLFCDDKQSTERSIKCSFPACTQKMHSQCAEDFVCSEYSPGQAKLLFCLEGPVCPSHMCWHCYEERNKNAARFGKFVDCEKCIRTFHVECIPAGTKINENEEGERGTIVCHEHVEKEPKITPNMRLKCCTECDELFDDSESYEDEESRRMECKKCTNVFHKMCSYKRVKGPNSEEYAHDICSHCLAATTIVANQKVLAFYPIKYNKLPPGNYPGTAVALSDVPAWIAKQLPDFGKVGFIPVRWEWTGAGAFYNMIPKSRVQRMTLNSEKSLPDDDFLLEAKSAKKQFKAPTYPLDNEAMMKTVEIVYGNVYMKGLSRLQEKKEIMECMCETKNNMRCSTDDCLNRQAGLECPKSCDEKEGVFCFNRAMQRPVEREKRKYEVKAAGNGKGFGIFATKTIMPLEYIFEYAGEVIDLKERDRRQARVSALRANDEWTYLMGLTRSLLVDARFKGGHARYVNHSCDPNAEVFSVDVPIKYPNTTTCIYEPRLKVQATKKIEVGEEITYRYELAKTRGLALDNCRCGANKCIGKIGEKKRKDDDDDERFDENEVVEDSDEEEMNEEEEEEEEEKENKKKPKQNGSAVKKTTATKRRASRAFSTPSSRNPNVTPKRRK